jgi:hypothetical protein
VSEQELTPAPESIFVTLDKPQQEANPARLAQPSSVQRDDVFSDQPAPAAIDLMPEDGRRGPNALSSTAGLAAGHNGRREANLALARLRRVQRASEPLPNSRLRLIALAILLIAAISGMIAYRLHHKASIAKVPVNLRPQCHIALVVDPSDASIEVDHLPATRGDLLVDQDASHVVHVSAPGRIARSFSFEAKPGLALSIHLERMLPLPAAIDGLPLSMVALPTYPTNPTPRDRITNAYAKLERYSQCLTLLDDTDRGNGKDGSAGAASGARMSRCVQLLDTASAETPEMPGLHKAGQAYLLGAQQGQSPPMLHQMLQRFAAEYLAVRSAWQMEELARQEADDGRTAAWHTRRVTLAALAWLREVTSPSKTARGLRNVRAWLDDSHRGLLEFGWKNPQAMAQISGGEAFAEEAEHVATLAREHPDKRPNKNTALTACLRLVTAFNKLVID